MGIAAVFLSREARTRFPQRLERAAEYFQTPERAGSSRNAQPAGPDFFDIDVKYGRSARRSVLELHVAAAHHRGLTASAGAGSAIPLCRAGPMCDDRACAVSRPRGLYFIGWASPTICARMLSGEVHAASDAGGGFSLAAAGVSPSLPAARRHSSSRHDIAGQPRRRPSVSIY